MLTFDQEHLYIQQAQERYNLLSGLSNLAPGLNRHAILRQGERSLVQLIEANERLVHRLTRYFASLYRDSSYEDLEQMAKKAVVEAVHTFDISKGTRLITWVFWKIRTELSVQSRKSKSHSAAQAAARATACAHSEPIEHDPVLAEQLEELLNRLTPYQREVVQRRMLGHTFKQIAQDLNRKAAAVRIMFNRQLQRLKHWLLPEPTPQPAPEPTPVTWMRQLRQRFKLMRGKCSFFVVQSHNKHKVSKSQTKRNLLMARQTASTVAVLQPTCRRFLLSWPVVGIGSTAMGQILQSSFLQQLCILYWLGVAGILLIQKYKPYVQRNRHWISLYYLGLMGLYGLPAQAQAAATCSTKGLFSEITNFVSKTFNNIKFSGGAATSLDGTICQVIGFLVFLVLISFIGVAMYVGFQVSYQQQPLTIALNPLVGFLIFAAISTVVISVMLGI